MVELQGQATEESAVDAARSVGIRIPDIHAVRSYIADHPDMASLIERMALDAYSALGSEADLSLEVYRDSEVDDHYLTLYVRKPELSAADLETIDRFSEEFAQPIVTASVWVIVLPDYRPSRSS
ncbi:MAG TPA: hypothetical protein VI756_19745 [Blastocatellia bacterium]